MVLGSSLVIGGLITLVVQIAVDFLDRLSAPSVERMTSLGSPEVVNLDSSTGEQKIILNDPSIGKNWGLMGTDGRSDIKIANAWYISQCDQGIRVAIIDTGADIHHPDLAENIWVNPGESGLDTFGNDKATNGIDDDGNGYVDDVHGWDFVKNSPVVVDNHGHGTHIAGIVGAVGGNNVGISGVCPKVSLMILKYYDPTARGNDNLKNTVRAIQYAIDKKAHIINYSGGGTEPNDDEMRAIKMASEVRDFAAGIKDGILFVAAAGNERSNSDLAPYYPADYKLRNIISVTAIDSYAKVLKSSNFGQKSVDLAAPGEGIYSTLPEGKYGVMTGTSQATAFVTGVAALILSHNKTLTAEQIKKQILGTVDELPGLREKTRTGGKLNSYAALAIQPPISATGITASNKSPLVGLVGKEAEVSEPASAGNNGMTGIMKALADDRLANNPNKKPNPSVPN